MKAKLIKLDNNYFLKIGDTTFATSATPNLSASIRHSLSLKNCQAIERGYDLERTADMFGSNVKGTVDYKLGANYGFEKGFQYALEILGDRKFTEEEAYKIWKAGQEYWKTSGESITFEELVERKVELLQQNEWEVEILTESIGRVKVGVGSKTEQMMPKLDANGCLVLRKIN